MTMATLKPYTCRTHFLLSISEPTSLRISRQHPTIVCARRPRGWSQRSNQKMLQLVSTVAFNLKILPEPLNSLAGEIARGDFNGFHSLVGGWRGKQTRRKRGKKQLAWFALVCVAGWWSWRVSEMDLFLKASLFCVVGVFLIRKKAIKEWFLGFLFGIVLVIGSGFGKEDVKFWVKKLMTGSPATQFAITNRNRNRNGRMSR